MTVQLLVLLSRHLGHLAQDPRSKAMEELRGIELADIACGRNHSVAVERAPKARVFTWGFGG